MFRKHRKNAPRRDVRRRSWFIAALIPLVLLSVACGGSEESSGGVASLGADTQDATGTGGEMSFEEAATKYAECMREQGVDVPDPTTREDGSTGFVITPEMEMDASRGEFEDADKKCRPILANAKPPEISEEDQEEMGEAALEFAECMREHGIDMPDPEFGEDGSVSIRVGGPGSDMDPENPSPEYEKAQEACGDLMRAPGRGE